MNQIPSPSNISTVEELRRLYPEPNPIVMDKVATAFDKHSAGFVEAARLVAVMLRRPDGGQVAMMTGGAAGFARPVDAVTMEIDVAAESWPAHELSPAANAGLAAGLLLMVPGVKETLRAKGVMTVSPTAGGSRFRLRLRITNTFFHCAKAFMRSRIWDAPQELTRWKGLRAFECVRRVRESETITSFYFQPIDGGALPAFHPGQHVPIEIARPGKSEPLRRTYSLSNRPGEDALRISVKRESPPAAGSGFLHDHVQVGSIVAMRSPAGKFVLDTESARSIVLLSAGVGLTPMISMLDHLLATRSRRRIWFVHAATSGREHAMGEHVRKLARTHDTLRVHVNYGRPGTGDRRGRDFHGEGRLTVDLFKRILPWDDYEFYLCGPASFMKAMIEGLTRNGVKPDRIRWEAFSSEMTTMLSPPAPKIARHVDASAEARVEFRRSGKSLDWAPGYASLLHLAEANGVTAPASCRAGTCFTCATRVISGEIAYVRELDDPPDAGTALICSAVPRGNVVLDL